MCPGSACVRHADAFRPAHAKVAALAFPLAPAVALGADGFVVRLTTRGAHGELARLGAVLPVLMPLEASPAPGARARSSPTRRHQRPSPHATASKRLNACFSAIAPAALPAASHARFTSGGSSVQPKRSSPSYDRQPASIAYER